MLNSNTKRAVFLDIDGTLLHRGTIPDEVDIQALEEACQGGHRIFLCTGRSWGNIPPGLREAPYISGVVAGSGAYVVLEGRVIHRRVIDRPMLGRICAFYLQSKKWCVIEGETGLFAINDINYDMFPIPLRPIRDAEDFKGIYRNEEGTKITIDGAISAPEAALLEGSFKLNPFPHYFEGIIKGESKAGGIERIIQELGMDQAATVGVGDSLNDMDMINFCGLGIAMGNACQELKEAADYITGNCGEGGVAQAIRRWVLPS